MTRQARSSSGSGGSTGGVVWTAEELEGNPHETADKAGRVRRMFDAIAHRYDLNNRVHSFGRDQAWRRRAVELCKVRPGDDVLDAACGTGDLAMAFARARPASVTGVDFADQMLRRAREKAQRRAGTAAGPEPRYETADVTALPFDDASFDIVSIAFGIRNVDEPAGALREFVRVLRPGGRLCVLEFSQPRNPLIRAINGVYCSRIMPFTASLLAGDRTGAYRYLPRSIITFADRERFADMMREAGCVDVATHPMTFGVCIAYVGVVAGGAASPARPLSGTSCVR